MSNQYKVLAVVSLSLAVMMLVAAGLAVAMRAYAFTSPTPRRVAVRSPAPVAATSDTPWKSSLEKSAKLLKCQYYNQQDFSRSLRVAKAYEAPQKIMAGIVPHHLLASEMIASFFEAAAQFESAGPET